MTEAFFFIAAFDIQALIGTIVGVLAVFIPLMAGLFQYRESIQQNQDKIFRGEVEKLTSKNREERLAAAINFGTFINRGNRFYDEAVNILINRTSVELDYNVLGAMVVSLRKVSSSQYKDIIQKLLDIDKNFFIQKYPLKKWRDKAQTQLTEAQNRLKASEDEYHKSQHEFNRVVLKNSENELDVKWQECLQKERDFDELEMHSQVVTDFISSFLTIVSKSSPITELAFNKNGLNNAVMENINLLKADIKASAFSGSSIRDANFERCDILNTVFTFSSITDSKFQNCQISSTLFDQTNLAGLKFPGCQFHDVFFLGSDLTDTDFRGVRGLKPIFFFLCKNIDRALFDKGFAKELQQNLGHNTEDNFTHYVLNSSLTKQRQDGLFLTLKELKERK